MPASPTPEPGDAPATSNATRPIGVFDSGIGGLSVVREIVRELPSEDVLYVADSRHAPYGDRTEAFIEQRSHALVAFLVSEGAKAIVVACNTATGVAIASLRERFALAIVGFEPAVKPATGQTRSGIGGGLATSRTLTSQKFARLREQFGGRARFVDMPCPGLVEQIESGDAESDATRLLLEGYLRPLLEEGADTIVLGCTHYVCLLPLIRRVAGPDVAVIEAAGPVARELTRRLTDAGLRAPASRRGSHRVVTSGDPRQVQAVIRRVWQEDVDVQPLPAESGAAAP